MIIKREGTAQSATFETRRDEIIDQSDTTFTKRKQLKLDRKLRMLLVMLVDYQLVEWGEGVRRGAILQIWYNNVINC